LSKNHKINNNANTDKKMINNRHPLTVNNPMDVKTAICIAMMSQKDPEINFFFILFAGCTGQK
jgi:hypothetical protein